jgi:DASS family divalent anion:Na+ symporter
VPVTVGLGVAMVPHDPALSDGWSLLSVFAATIAGLIVRPLPSGGVVLVGITVASGLGLIPIQEALSGFANTTVWLIVSAFLFARGFIQSRLGERIAYYLIAWFGGSALRLAYALVAADLAMAPVTASNTARAGGVLFPIALGVSRAFGSEPGPTATRLGSFLMLAVFQADLVVSAMFLTSMAANPLVAELAGQTTGVAVTWSTWALAAMVPGFVGMAVVPWLVYRLCPPEVRATSSAQALARERLAAMGPMSAAQQWALVVFALVLGLWVTTPVHGVSSTTVAFIGVVSLLLTRVLAWHDVVEEQGAWDALIWFGGLVMLADRLNAAGLMRAFADATASHLPGWSGMSVLIVIILVYVYSHYAFASMTAHVTAMFPAFYALAVMRGAPPLLSALAFGFFGNLSAAMTHYGTGPAVVFFGSGYIPQGRWWRIGFLLSLVHVIVWLGTGLVWWKVLGLW